MQDTKIKVGMIGTGGIVSWGHIPAILTTDLMEVAWLCSANRPEMEALAATHQIKKLTADYHDVLKDPAINIVFVATPTFLHKDITIAALAAGKDVLCEKPPALNAAETREMIDAASRHRRVLMFGLCYRQMDNGQVLKQCIDAGKLGEIYYAKAGWIRQRGYPNKGSWFTQKSKSGGGPLIDIGPHCLDRALWLMGYPQPATVYGVTYQKMSNTAVNPPMIYGANTQGPGICDVEDLAVGMIRFRNGATLAIEVSYAVNHQDDHYYCDFFGTKAGAHLKRDKTLVIYGEEDGKLTETKPIQNDCFEPDVIYQRQIVELVRRARQRDLRQSENENILTMMKIIDGLYQSAATGRLVEV